MRQLIFFFGALGLILAGCSAKQEAAPSKPLLLVSIAPYKTLVEQIAGDSFEVIAVVPLNADPHTYEPTSRQLTQVARGEMWFRIGESFEAKLLPLVKAKSVDLREGVVMIEDGGCKCHGHLTQDRHIWLSPKLLSTQAVMITAQLSKQYPEKREAFAARLSQLQVQLAVLDGAIEQKIHGTLDRSFLVSHPAFGYFCRDYNCQQLSVEHEGKEPRPKEVEVLMSAAIEKQAKIAISLPQHNNKGAQLIAGKLHIPVRMVDPYAADYSATMLKLATLIANPYELKND